MEQATQAKVESHWGEVRYAITGFTPTLLRTQTGPCVSADVSSIALSHSRLGVLPHQPISVVNSTINVLLTTTASLSLLWQDQHTTTQSCTDQWLFTSTHCHTPTSPSHPLPAAFLVETDRKQVHTLP